MEIEVGGLEASRRRLGVTKAPPFPAHSSVLVLSATNPSSARSSVRGAASPGFAMPICSNRGGAWYTLGCGWFHISISATFMWTVLPTAEPG